MLVPTDEIEPTSASRYIMLAAPIPTPAPTPIPAISAGEKVLIVLGAPIPTPAPMPTIGTREKGLIVAAALSITQATSLLQIAPTMPAFPPTIEILEQSPSAILFGGSATPNSTISVLTNHWTVGVTSADEFGRWEQLIFFPTVATYVIYARQLDSHGMEIFSSNVIEWQETLMQPVDELPENTVIAVTSAVERCAGENQIGVLLPDHRYRVGVCQSLADIGRQLGVYLALLVHANPQIENPRLVYPGQIINLP